TARPGPAASLPAVPLGANEARRACTNRQTMDSGIGLIILAMVAVFLVARLYRVLGRRTGNERRRDPFAGAANDDQRRDAVLPIPDRTRPARADDAVAPAPTPTSPADAAAGPLLAGMARIRSADPQFDPATFVAGART